MTDDIQCPLCGSITTILTAKKGSDAGKKFHVCINYPECKGKVKYQTKVTDKSRISVSEEVRCQSVKETPVKDIFIYRSICQCCGRVAQTKHVALYRSIGMIIMRQSASIKGDFCKKCASFYFWEYTLTTLAAGWWSPTSFVLSPFYILINIFYYLRTLKMETPEEE
jgi:ssDNA-binding Zn-finger/Zn-ribbon topoisomerase 1